MGRLNKTLIIWTLAFSLAVPSFATKPEGCPPSLWKKLYTTARDVVTSVATGQPLPRAPRPVQSHHERPAFYTPPTVDLPTTVMNMIRFIRDPLRMFQSLQGGDGVRIFHFPWGPDVITVSDYNVAKQVLLKTGKDPIERDPIATQAGANVYGRTNVFLGNPEQHKIARGYVSKAFSPGVVFSPPIVQSMHTPARDLVNALGSHGNQPVDVVAESKSFALHAMLRTAFGLELSRDEIMRDVWPHFERVNSALTVDTLLSNTGVNLASLPTVLPIQRKLNESRAALDKLVDRIIENGRRPDAPKDFLFYDLLRDPKVPNDYLRGIIKTTIAGAMETSASYMYWPIKELARRPEMVDEIRKEIKEVVGDGPIKAEHIPKLVKLERFLKETGRQYTPFYMTARRAFEDMVLQTPNGPVKVKKGSQFLISLYGANHDPNVFNVQNSGYEPDAFHPLRFAEPGDEDGRDAKSPEPLTFGHGKHKCVGINLAHLEGMIGVAEIIRGLDMKDANGGKDSRITSGLVTKPGDGINVIFTPRRP